MWAFYSGMTHWITACSSNPKSLHKLEEVFWVNTNTLKPHPKNPNKHSKDQIERLAKILRYQGFRSPIVVSNLSGFIVSGHGRLQAAKLNKWTKVPVVKQDFEDETQEYAYIVSDNAIAEWAELQLEEINLETMTLGPFDTDLLGIKNWETIPEDKYADKDADSIPEVAQNELGVQLGDIYQLGEHRLMCGDSTDLETVEKLMSGKRASVCFTSPPYNGNTHLDYGKGNNKKLYDNDYDNKSSKEYIEFCHKVLNVILELTQGFIFWNVNYNAKSRFEYIKGIYPFLDYLHETIIWKKTSMPIPSGLTRNCEFIFVFKNGIRNHISDEFKTEFNLWDISNIGSQDISTHRACFPVALPQKGIEIASIKDEIILDPFLGSGSTLIACEKTNRKCYGMELDPHYCSVIIKRWETFTGKKASKVSV